MAEHIYADSLFSGSVSTASNAYGASNGTFTTDAGDVDWTARFGLDNPAAAISPDQSVAIDIVVRRDSAGGNDPTVDSITLYDGATSKGSDATGWSITSTTGETISVSISATGLTSSGADLRVEIATTASGGAPSGRRAVQLDSVDVTVQNSGAVDLAGAGDAASSGSGDITVEVPLSGAGDASSDGSGDITVEVPLSGSGASASTGYGRFSSTVFQELSLDNGGGAPDSQTGHWLSVRGRTNDAANSATLVVWIYEGGSEIWNTSIVFSGSTSFVTKEVSIPDAVTLGITNYADLSVGFQALTDASEFHISEGPSVCYLGPLKGQISLSGTGGGSASSGRGVLGKDIDLSGAGSSASASTDLLSVTRGLIGSGDTASSGRGVLGAVSSLSGSGQASGEGYGILSAEVELSGAGDAASDGYGVLFEPSVDLSGSGSASSSGSGSMTRLRSISCAFSMGHTDTYAMSVRTVSREIYTTKSPNAPSVGATGNRNRKTPRSRLVRYR